MPEADVERATLALDAIERGDWDMGDIAVIREALARQAEPREADKAVERVDRWLDECEIEDFQAVPVDDLRAVLALARQADDFGPDPVIPLTPREEAILDRLEAEQVSDDTPDHCGIVQVDESFFERPAAHGDDVGLDLLILIALGAMRDDMPPRDVAAVQRFAAALKSRQAIGERER